MRREGVENCYIMRLEMRQAWTTRELKKVIIHDEFAEIFTLLLYLTHTLITAAEAVAFIIMINQFDNHSMRSFSLSLSLQPTDFSAIIHPNKLFDS